MRYATVPMSVVAEHGGRLGAGYYLGEDIDPARQVRALSLVLGGITTLAAAHGWDDLDATLAGLKPLLEQRIAARGRPFADDVRARREPGVDDPRIIRGTT